MSGKEDIDCFSFNPSIYFVCKLCRQLFQDTVKLILHKISDHSKEELRGIKCIIFEENFSDSDISVHTLLQSECEVLIQEYDDYGVLAVSPPPFQNTEQEQEVQVVEIQLHNQANDGNDSCSHEITQPPEPLPSPVPVPVQVEVEKRQEQPPFIPHVRITRLTSKQISRNTPSKSSASTSEETKELNYPTAAATAAVLKIEKKSISQTTKIDKDKIKIDSQSPAVTSTPINASATIKEDANGNCTSLGEWLKLEKLNNPSNVILLDPDPTQTTTASTSETVTITEPNESLLYPITCVLCKLKLTSKAQVKEHVQICWQVKGNHSYCVLCKRSFALKRCLATHISRVHSGNIAKSKPKPTKRKSKARVPVVDPVPVPDSVPVTAPKTTAASKTKVSQKSGDPDEGWVEVEDDVIPAADNEEGNGDDADPEVEIKCETEEIPSSDENEDDNVEMLSEPEPETESETEPETELESGRRVSNRRKTAPTRFIAPAENDPVFFHDLHKLSFTEWLRKQSVDNPDNIIMIEPDPLQSGAGTDAEATNSDVNPANTDADPANTDTGPAIINVDPANTDANVANTDENPANTDANAANTDVNAANTDANPANTDANPANTDANPANTDANVANTDVNPGNTDANAANTDANPTNTDVNPTNTDVNPAHADVNSTNSKTDVIPASTDAGTTSNFKISSANPITCKLCCKKLNKDLTARTHLEMCFRFNKKSHKYCILCSKAFSDQRAFRYHLQSKHPQSESSAFGCDKGDFRKKCKVCHKVVTTSGLRYHQELHADPSTKKFICEVCGEAFLWQWSLRRHGNTHTRDRSFKCEHCPNTYFTKRALDDHQHIHTSVKTHPCTICGNSFATRYSLICHTRNHTGDLPFPCTKENCSKTFPTKLSVLRHCKRDHGETGLEKIQCTLCSRAFFSNANLKSHMVSHTSEKRFQCSENGCSLAFKAKLSYKQHLLTHSPDNPFQCEVCGNAYGSEPPFKRHMKSHRSVVIVTTSEAPVPVPAPCVSDNTSAAVTN